ncbi:translation initiation factor 2 (bIF-2) [Nitrospirillum amazonense]|uniref:Translation initiation factor IF-2 n=1 Tax=Nitrospirillum amazonense TaxID=28077 RepID=A0A560FLD7_9PROT|nr:translation initiation factor IF-2 [Nitrospirillum amazonense]TWB22441.1 translation initiation factor 2 (bIF-2) [Nitrospirillum amazonense]
MTDTSDQDRKKLSLTGRGKLELKKTVDAGSVRQSFSHGRTKTVAVEVKRKRTFEQGARPGVADGGAAARAAAEGRPAQGGGRGQPPRGGAPRQLTDSEREARLRALRAMGENPAQEDVADELLDEVAADDLPMADEAPAEAAPAPEPLVEEPVNDGPLDDETLRRRELEELRMIQEEEKRVAAEAEKRRQEEEAKRKEAEAARKAEEAPRAARPATGNTASTTTAATDAAAPRGPLAPRAVDDEDDEGGRRRAGPGGAAKTASKVAAPAPAKAAKGGERRRNAGKLTISQALSDEGGGAQRGRSMAALRRAREREKQRLSGRQDTQKVTRDVIIPEVITVQELANRMAERGADVIKALMRMGVMATITQNIDTDTAELIVTEFGHRAHRVSEADVEVGVKGDVDRDEDLSPRPPVVTVMGHVDHGKTSLLDALRHTDVASREAGGITQHIGAYQVQLASGSRITFIDTPGHAAFTEMRARGANVTDVVVLVVAADDGVMPQTVEAIQHAKAAEVPIIIAINKCDLPGAKPDRVRQELLQHGLVVEAMGGDVLDVEVSAKTGKGLDKLEENILLQAEILELKANPARTAEGVVVEAKLERGRGSVATMLVQRGTLKVGDIVVAGSEWGRVRALVNDRGQNVESAGPATPVEVLGLNATPLAGDEFSVVESEARAREITEFRQRKKREAQVAQSARGSLEQMFKQIQAGEVKELPLVIKGDVQGSIEAISGTLEKLAGDNAEVKVRVLHSGVGAINESDVTLANASRGIIIGFNVRANPQAREMAKRDNAEIRYYSVIYDIIDDVRALLTGMLKPVLRERFLGNAQILEVFNITKVGKVGGCRVTEGIVKRGAGVRLLRDNVVIHEGTLKTLKRFKDEVKEVREGYECGMAFENYDNIQPGDVIEAYEMEEVARAL